MRSRSGRKGAAEGAECFLAVKEADVLGLRGGKPTDGPGEMHEVRLARGEERMHPALCGQMISLFGVAGAARRHDVRPVVVTTA